MLLHVDNQHQTSQSFGISIKHRNHLNSWAWNIAINKFPWPRRFNSGLIRHHFGNRSQFPTHQPLVSTACSVSFKAFSNNYSPIVISTEHPINQGLNIIINSAAVSAFPRVLTLSSSQFRVRQGLPAISTHKCMLSSGVRKVWTLYMVQNFSYTEFDCFSVRLLWGHTLENNNVADVEHSVRLSIRPSIRPSVRLSVTSCFQPSDCSSFCPSVRRSVRPLSFVRPSIRSPSVLLLVRQSVPISIRPSVSQSVPPSNRPSVCLKYHSSGF